MLSRVRLSSLGICWWLVKNRQDGRWTIFCRSYDNFQETAIIKPSQLRSTVTKQFVMPLFLAYLQFLFVYGCWKIPAKSLWSLMLSLIKLDRWILRRGIQKILTCHKPPLDLKIIGRLTQQKDLPNVGRSLEQEKQEICNCTAATQSCKYENSTGINLSKQCSRCGSWEQHPGSKCPAKRSKCFKCGYFGHYAKECRSRSKATDILHQVKEYLFWWTPLWMPVSYKD